MVWTARSCGDVGDPFDLPSAAVIAELDAPCLEQVLNGLDIVLGEVGLLRQLTQLGQLDEVPGRDLSPGEELLNQLATVDEAGRLRS